VVQENKEAYSGIVVREIRPEKASPEEAGGKKAGAGKEITLFPKEAPQTPEIAETRAGKEKKEESEKAFPENP